MAFIKGSWESTKLVCGNHEGPDYPSMVLQAGTHSLSYVCSKCTPLEVSDEQQCKNELSVTEYEKLLSFLANFSDGAEESGEEFHLEHYRWSKKAIDYEVIKHTSSETVVKVFNKLAVNKK